MKGLKMVMIVLRSYIFYVRSRLDIPVALRCFVFYFVKPYSDLLTVTYLLYIDTKDNTAPIGCARCAVLHTRARRATAPRRRRSRASRLARSRS